MELELKNLNLKIVCIFALSLYGCEVDRVKVGKRRKEGEEGCDAEMGISQNLEGRSLETILQQCQITTNNRFVTTP